MNAYGNQDIPGETSISLRALFWSVLKRWKTILIVMAALAVLLGAYQGFKSFRQYKAQAQKSSTDSTEEDSRDGENAIVVQPQNLTVAANTTATFSIKTSGKVQKYQWQYSKDGMSWNSLNTSTYPSAATQKLTFNALAAQNNYIYRCSVTFEGGQVISSEGAVLTVSGSSSAKKLTKGDVLKNALKSAVLGAVLGMLLSVFCFAVQVVSAGIILNGADLESRYGRNSFGVYPSRKYTGFTRKIMDKMTYRPDVTQQESAKLIAASMNLALPDSGPVYLTGTVDDKRLEAVCKVLQPHVKADLKLLSCVNQSAASVGALQEKLPVVCVERVLASRRTYVDFQMNTIARSGSECAGFVLIE